MERTELADQMKLRYLKEIELKKPEDTGFLKADVISGINNPELKQSLLREMSDPFFQDIVVGSFDDQKFVDEYLEKRADKISGYVLTEILAKDNISDEIKKKYFSKISHEQGKAEVLRSIKDISFVEKHLGEIQNAEYKAEVIVSFADDAIKQKYIDEITDELARSIIVASMQDDKTKLQYISDMKSDMSKAKIIASCQSEELKEEYLQDIENEGARAVIVASFESYSLKRSYLYKMKQESSIATVVANLGSDEAKYNYLRREKTIEKESYIIAIAKSMEDPEFIDGVLERLPVRVFSGGNSGEIADLLAATDSYQLKTRYATLFEDHESSKIIGSITGQESDFPEEYWESVISSEESYKTEEKEELKDLSTDELKRMVETLEEQKEKNEEKITRAELLNKIKELQSIVGAQEKEIAELEEAKEKQSAIKGDKDER